MDNSEYRKEYAKWIASLTPEEKEKVIALGVEKPLLDDDGGAEKRSKKACAGRGMSFEGKKGIGEPDALRLGKLAESSRDIEIITNRTPFDDLLTKEELAARLNDTQETAIKQEAVSGILSYFFKPKNGACPNPFEVLCRVFCLCYVIRPQLISRWDTLEKIADIFDSTKQRISKEVLKLQNYGLKARQGKGFYAVSKYRENTLAWHRERIARERKEKRKEYLKEYNAARREEKKRKNAEYYAKNKERLLSEQREKRSKANKKGK